MRIPIRKPGKYALLLPDPLLTEGKIAELKNKLSTLKNISKPKAMAEVARLAQTGDFSENAGYQFAKGKLRGINNGIITIERQLRQAVIIEPQQQTETVHISHKVTVMNNERKQTFHILGSSETNPAKGIISHNSPIGAALLGHKVGDTVTVVLAKGNVAYTILKIE